MLNLTVPLIRRVCLFFITLHLLLISYVKSATLTVTPSPSIINVAATYQWVISGLTTTSNHTIILNFPTDTSFNQGGTSKLLAWDNSQYSASGLTFANNNVTFTLITDLSNTSFIFQVTNVLNAPYQTYETFNFVFGSSSTTSTTSLYTAGPILNCNLNFAGVTGQQVSTANVSFKTTNPISKNNLLFKITYGTNGVYNSASTKIVDNRNITCQLSINGGSFGSQVSATILTDSPIFNCNFTGLNLSANADVILKLNYVVNPPYTTNYIFGSFQVDSSDGVKFYDSVSACTPNPVSPDTYAATLDQSSYYVNSIYSNPTITTTNIVTKTFLQNDEILIIHDGVNFPTLGTYIMFSRPISKNQLQFSVTSGTSSTNINTKYTGVMSNIQSDQIALKLVNFQMLIPPSSSPMTILFKFYRNSLEYMNIYTTVTASPVIFVIGDLTVTPTSGSIGDKTDYTFQIKVSQPLSTNARFLITLPLDVNLTLFNSATSNCIFTSTDPNPQPKCSIYDSINKIMQVDINTTSIISPQNVSIKIGDIINPSNPQRVYNFGVQSIYDQADSQSTVQLGSSLYPYTYTYRAMNIITDNPSYTVNQYPSVFTLKYIPGVDIPSNLNIVFTFTSSMISVVYKNITINGSPYVYTNSQSGQTITLTVGSMIPLNSTVLINFQFRAPPYVSYFNALNSIQVKSVSNVLYQVLSPTTTLTINVLNPASEVFSITPVSAMTGTVTNYTINFYTNVNHPSIFYLRIVFPSDVTINTSTMKCAPTNICTGIINKSIVGQQQIWLNITASGSGNTYTITVTSITNSRTIGFTGLFQFETLTNSVNGSVIINGSANALISLPNVASPSFDLSKSYYKMNTQPVSINVRFTNKLQSGDFIRIFFDYRTYTLANNNSAGVVCSNAACSYDSSLSTSYTIVIKVVPNNTIVQPIIFSIQGLNSSATTYITQKFQVILSSYDSLGRQMDQGNMTYNLSCGSTSALINKICQICNQPLGYCLTCYQGYFLFNGACVTSCASASTYQSYPGSGVCVPCISPCSTCISSAQCLTCSTGIYLYQNSSCLAQCNNGFYKYTTASGQLMCLKCWSPFCIKCNDGGSSSCTDCGTAFLQAGRCLNTCDSSTSYVDNITSQCLPCDSSCNGCAGKTSADCLSCKTGYYNISGKCVSSCPQGSVALTGGVCGCQGNCSTCQQVSTRCLSCKNVSYYLYNYQCLTSCPASSYQSGSICLDCNQGCLSCNSNTCIQCLPGYNVYQSSCYTDCNILGERYAAISGMCIECPSGCDLCDAALNCSVCLSNYTLVNSACVRTCQLQNSCEIPSVVPVRKLPIPGFITASVWLLTLVILKLFILQKIYVPYSFMFVGCIIEYVLVIAVLAGEDSAIKTLLANSTKRLLQTVVSNSKIELPQSYQYAVIGLLATSLALNYISNFVYLFLFCKYLRRYVPDRQIDKISNYLVLVIGTLTNFRFSLIAYCKMFPKPNILVQNQSKLTPLHYMCIGSIFTAVLPLITAGILIYNEVPLTNLFMLGIDLLIIVLLELIFTIWIVSVDKPDDYFESTKKYSKEEFNQTTEGINEKQDPRNLSKARFALSINNVENSMIQVQQIDEETLNEKAYTKMKSSGKGNIRANKSDNQNDPLPSIPNKSSHAHLQTIKIRARQHIQNEDDDMDLSSLQDKDRDKAKQKGKLSKGDSLSEQRTLRNTKNRTQIKKVGAKVSPQANRKQADGKANDQQPQDNNIKLKARESTANFSKEKKPIKARINNADIHHQKQKKAQGMRKGQKQQASNQQIQSQYFEDDHMDDISQQTMKQVNSQIMKREKKVLKSQTQRSSLIMPTTMKKKQSFGVFESEKAVSQVDEIDFDSLIQTKMIDKTKDKSKTKPLSNNDDDVQYEQISPSWFNQENQRFDFDENSDV